jgi:hypothetical protein
MQASCSVMKGGDGVEYYTHRSESRHQDYISLAEEFHHPTFASKLGVPAISSQPMQQPSRLFTRSAARAIHVLKTIPARGSDTIVIDFDRPLP